MAGAHDNEKSTSLHISGRFPTTETKSGHDYSQQPLAPELAAALRDFGKHIANLNALLLNGIPLQVSVQTPSPINHIHVDAPSVNVQSPNVEVKPEIIVEPPVVRVEAPMVRVDASQPAPHVNNVIKSPAPLFTRGEAIRWLSLLLSLLAVLSISAVLAIWHILHQ